MNYKDIIIGNHYIITKNINGEIKEQFARIDSKYENGQCEYSYGYIRTQDGICNIANIRELTDDEVSKSEKYWDLPHQFYHSPVDL